MKKNRKTILCLLITLSVLFGLSLSVYAETTASQVEINSKELVITTLEGDTGSDLFTEFKNVMPGDELVDEIAIINKSDFDYVKVYLRVVAHDEEENPLSTETGETVESMQDFLAQLNLTLTLGETTLFKGDADAAGLEEGTLYLGSIAYEETITLTAMLSVPITLDNTYAGRFGEIDWELIFEGYHVDQLTARKVWTGDTTNHPKTVTVNLYRDGELADTQILSEANQWIYTWGDLDQDYAWTVLEEEVEGYTTSYTIEGNVVTIANDKPVQETVVTESKDLTVIKKWDDEGSKNRPASVSVTLYNGETAVETVVLSDANSWTYSWSNLSGNGQWQVVETNIPKGYVPSYQADGTTVTITNTQTLIQTGQLFWPIPVLCLAGVAMIGFGLVMMRKKQEKENA